MTTSLSLVSDVTISLSAHPPFVLPTQGPGVDLKEAFPAPLHEHLKEVTRLFSMEAGTVGMARVERKELRGLRSGLHSHGSIKGEISGP